MLNLTAATLLAISPTPVTVGASSQSPVQTAPEPRSTATPPPEPSPEPVADGQRAGRSDAPLPDAPAQEPRKDILVTGRRQTVGDPLQALNAKSFAATQAVDTAVIGPAARIYQHGLPKPVRIGIHNFLYNLREPIIFLNFMLQLKPGKAAETFGRFAVNSTVGAAGLVDVARRRPFRLPRRANGFADTLGYYGVKNGPFLFLPITGPTTVRDLIGGTIDRLILPVAVGKPFTSTAFTAPLGVLGALDHRADFDPTLRKLHDGTTDAYTSTKAFYLSRRQAEIDHLRGRGPGLSTPVGEAPVDSGVLPGADPASRP